MNTDVAVLDAASEEINNSIFRSGHIALGFSSPLLAPAWHWKHSGSVSMFPN
jgi:hypothetical protein